MTQTSLPTIQNLQLLPYFIGALVGALAGALFGESLGADLWLIQSLAEVQSESLYVFLSYHIGLFGGPHVVVGAFLGILTIGVLDVFFGEDASLGSIVIAVLLLAVAGFIVLIHALITGQIGLGASLAIVAGALVIIWLVGRSGGGGAPVKLK